MIPLNLIVNADDFGINNSVNKAILFAFQEGYINSTSLIPNREGYEGAVKIYHNNKAILKHIGVHVNLADGMPVTKFNIKAFVKANGEWDIGETGKKLQFFSKQTTNFFKTEIKAQIIKVLSSEVPVTHLDSHLHLHTLPKFMTIFLELAAEFNLKLRLAQTYKEDDLFKFLFRRFLNNKIKRNALNYSDKFETVDHFLLSPHSNHNLSTEIMLHPCFDEQNNLTDHYMPSDMYNWLNFYRSYKA